jgi:hypothetical protein
MVCGKCGHHNPEGRAFCEECDAFLEWHGVSAPRPEPPPPGPAPRMPPAAARPAPARPPAGGPARGDAGRAPSAATAGTAERRSSPREAAPAAPAAPGAPAVRPDAPPAERQVAAQLARGIDKAREQGRADLVERLEAARDGLARRELWVVVAGEYKQGKSTLVNAVVQSQVCPVDDDVVTAVPTIVRYGPDAGALLHLGPEAANGDGGDPGGRADRSGATGGRSAFGLDGDSLPIGLDQVGPYVRGDAVPAPGDDDGDPLEPGRVRSVEVQLNRRILDAGLSFVDSPGAGGLESAEGSIVLGVLGLAEALLFVTDASQELTRAELTFLQTARARCAKVLCVVTKTDLHPEWRRIVELDREHLARADLDVPLVPVSSFLRMRAAASVDAAMNDESGFPALIEYLRSHVVADGAAERAAHAASEVAFAARELARGWQAESDVMAGPVQAAQVVQRLTRAASATEALQGSAAPWQQVLADGIQDLVANVDHDLRERLKLVVRSGEDIIARSDPADSWTEFEAWLRRQVVIAAVATYDYLTGLAGELTERVGRQFQQDANSPIVFSITAPVAALERIELGGSFSTRGSRSSMVLSAARGSYGGMLMFGMAGSLLGIPVAAPVMLLMSLGLGRRAVREERARRHQQHQAEARAALNRYAQEVGFIVDKECKDALRRTQRLLRDEFGRRARSLHQTTTAALASAQRAMELDESAQADRRRVAEREIGELRALGSAPAGAAIR